ncbi:MAG: hypothetical protein ACRCV9_16345 [Burkholderiaceae bacterium]
MGSNAGFRISSSGAGLAQYQFNYNSVLRFRLTYNDSLFNGFAMQRFDTGGNSAGTPLKVSGSTGEVTIGESNTTQLIGGGVCISRGNTGNFATSGGPADAAVTARILSGTNAALDVGARADSSMQIQARNASSFATNNLLRLQPNGGRVLVGGATDSGAELVTTSFSALNQPGAQCTVSAQRTTSGVFGSYFSFLPGNGMTGNNAAGTVTVQREGFYSVNARYWAQSGTGGASLVDCFEAITLNGSIIASTRFQKFQTNTAFAEQGGLSFQVYCSVGDVISLFHQANTTDPVYVFRFDVRQIN